MAMEGVQRRNQTGGLQQNLVAITSKVPGRAAALDANRGGLRSRGKISRARQRALYALLPRPHPPVPILSGDVQGCGPKSPAPSSLLLRQSQCWSETQSNAPAGLQPALARGVESLDRRRANE